MSALPENLVLKVVSEIHDPVTTTDELIPSGETSSYRSNPLGLAEFALSRKDPEYVGRAKEIQKAQKAVEAGTCPLEVVEELKPVMETIEAAFENVGRHPYGLPQPEDPRPRHQEGFPCLELRQGLRQLLHDQ